MANSLHKNTEKTQEETPSAWIMAEDFVFGNFLGLPEKTDSVDIAILQVPYELTTSYGQGTALGPEACIEASTQVELFDSDLGEDLPGNQSIFTAKPWDGEGSTLLLQLDGISNYLSPWFHGDCFPLVLGGEHGILPPLVNACRNHKLVNNDLSNLTIVQIDAHADLRSELGGEKFSHACAAARSLELGIKELFQAGIRAYSKEENEIIQSDTRITTFFARDTQNSNGGKVWSQWLEQLDNISGPVHLTIDIDGLDGVLVPATGTPVPGGLTFWQVAETITTLFNSKTATVVSADINEIVPQEDTPLTQFTAAMLAAKVVASQIISKREGRWQPHSKQQGKIRQPGIGNYFSSQSS